MKTDNMLVKQILEGDTDCFTSLVNKYYPKVLIFIQKMGVDKHDSEDLAQDVFVKVYNHLYKYNEKWSFSTWLFRITVNTYKDFRKRKRINTQEINEETLPINMKTVEDHIEDLYHQQLIQEMLNILDEDVKAMMILYYCHSFSLKEIGEVYKTTPDAIKMKLFRARNKLGKMAENHRMDGEVYEV